MAKKNVFNEPVEEQDENASKNQLENLEKGNNDSVPNEVSDYNPLAEKVKERPYTKPNLLVDTNNPFEPIPEPLLQKPVISLSSELKKEDKPIGDEKKEEPKLVNEQMKDMSEEEKKRSAETVVDMFLDVYGMVNTGVGKIATISDKEKNKIAQKVPIDFPLQLSPTQTITLNQLIDKTNADITDVCKVTEEFNKKVKPPLVRIAIKRGLGLTDEQQVAYLFIKDLGEKTAVLYSLRSVINGLVTQIQQQNEIIKNQPHNNSTNYAASPVVESVTETENNNVQNVVQEEEKIESAQVMSDVLVSEVRTRGRKKSNKASEGLNALELEDGEA